MNKVASFFLGDIISGYNFNWKVVPYSLFQEESNWLLLMDYLRREKREEERHLPLCTQDCPSVDRLSHLHLRCTQAVGSGHLHLREEEKVQR